MKNTLKWYKYWKQACICMIMFVSGLMWSIIGPTTPDLCLRMDISEEEIGQGLAVSSFTWIVGSLVFGVIMDRFHRLYEVFLCGTMLALGCILIIIPLTPYFWVFVVCQAIKGLADAVMETVVNKVTLALWLEAAAGKLLIMNSCWAVGTVFAPLIVKPFLASESSNSSSFVTTPTMELQSLEDDTGSRIEIAYAICGSIAVCVGVVHMANFLAGAPQGFTLSMPDKSSLKEILSLGKATQTKLSFALPMCIMFTLYFFILQGAMNGAFYFTYSFALASDLDFTNQEAANLDAASKLGYTVGHWLIFCLTKVVRVQPLLTLSLAVSLGVSVGLCTLGVRYKTWLYVFSIAGRVVSAGLWSLGFAFTDQYLMVTAVVITFGLVGSGAGGMVFNWLYGWVFNNLRLEALFYGSTISFLALFILFGVMWFMGQRYGKRFHNQQTTDVKDSSDTVVEKGDLQSEIFVVSEKPNVVILGENSDQTICTKI